MFQKSTCSSQASISQPPRSGRTLVFGTLAVAGGIGLVFANLHRRQRKKEELDAVTGGAIPTWEHRIHQSNHPQSYPDLETLRASSVAPRSSPAPPPARGQKNRHVTLATFFSRPDSTPESRYQQPAPQRSSADDPSRAYTKSPDYSMSYEETPKQRQEKNTN
ncbi:hypothetical protein F5I97DRAFT_1829515 [Phlebopus sp. FC_14]|nr:hypothetical protein F5I97DRAFT_1829515 [Phlebopus sp. FC_14]